MSARAGTVSGLGKTRVEALTDGIFGAVMTVLGLSLTIPYITGPANQQLPALEDIVTGVLTYALSFVTVGVFWVGHHVGFQIVKRTDRTFIGLNLLAIQIFVFLTLWYATLHHHLVEAGLNDRFIWLARRRMLMGPGFSAAAILVSFLNPVLSLGAYVLYPVFFIVPGRIDRLWRRQEVN